MKHNQAKKQLIVGLIINAIFIITNSLQLLYSSFLFVKVVSLLIVIVSSILTGAFIREWFIIKEKARTNAS